MAALQTANPLLQVPPAGHFGASNAADEPGEDTPTEDASSNEELEAEEAEAKGLQKILDESPAPTGFVTSITSGGHRRLHLVGSCRLVPGENYKNYVEHGDKLPEPEEFHSRCRWCFPLQEALADDKVLPSNSSSSSSSSSSDES